MRICLVSRELAPFQGGGIGTYVSLMARALAGAGHEVHVLTQAHRGLPREQGGVRFHPVDLERNPAGWDAYALFPHRWAMGVHMTLLALHRAHRFELIEVPEFYGEGYFAIRAKRLLGEYAGAVLAVKLHTPSWQVRGLNAVAELTGESAGIDHMERESILRADLLLSPTASLLERVRAELGALPTSAVVRNPFAPDWTDQLGARESEREGEILYFGRLERRKGVHLLVPALEKLHARGIDASLRLIGGDTPTGPGGRSMRAYLERQIPEALRTRVSIEEGRERGRLNAAIGRASVCCFPSLWENFPNVCLEAMAAGKGVVASDAGGMAEILAPGRSGWLFRSGEVDALAEALAEALTDGEDRRKVGARARERLMEVCSPASVVRSLEEAVREVTLRETPHAKAVPSAGIRPLVSVIVPFYNLGGTLPATLASIEAQTFRDFEVVVVDDGSTDPDSRAVIEAIAESERMRVLRKSNGGLSSARNAGVAEARGQYVLPLDADDLIAPTFVEKTLSILERDPGCDYVTSLVRFFVEDPEVVCGGYIPWGCEADVLLAQNVAGPCTALFRRERLEEVGGYDEWLIAYEDWDLFCALAERGCKGEVLPEFLFYYRVRPDSMARALSARARLAARSRLMEKHPTLMSERALRLLAWQAEQADEKLSNARYVVIDRINEGLKRLPLVHGLLKRTLG